MTEPRGNIIIEPDGTRWWAHWSDFDWMTSEAAWGDTPDQARDALLARSGPQYYPPSPRGESQPKQPGPENFVTVVFE